MDLIRTRFVPVAVNQSLTNLKQEASRAEGDLIRAFQADKGKQGVHVLDPEGRRLGYQSTDSYDLVKGMLKQILEGYKPSRTAAPEASEKGRVFHEPPAGGLVIRVTKFIEEGDPGWAGRILRYDTMWIRADEASALVRGSFPESLSRRLAAFHLLYAHCGAGRWLDSDIRKVDLKLEGGRLIGVAHLEASEKVRYRPEIRGLIEAKDGKVTRFDVVARGRYVSEDDCRDRGRMTPSKEMSLSIAFTLVVDRNEAPLIPPGVLGGGTHGMLVSLEEYLR